MNIAREFTRIYNAYLADRPHTDPDPTQVYASSLGYCPLYHALKRSGAEPVIKPTLEEETSLLHLMRQGVQDAEPIQEAFLKAFPPPVTTDELSFNLACGLYRDVSEVMGSDTIMAFKEVSVDGGYWRGRADLLLFAGQTLHIIEIKRRDIPDWLNKVEPKRSDMYQMLAYKLALEPDWPGEIICHLVGVNRYFTNWWRMEPDQDYYYMVDEIDERSWCGRNGSLITMSENEFQNEVSLHREYLAGRRDDPRPDFLNHEQSWECGKWLSGKKPKVGQGGAFVPKCAFWCHGESEKILVRHDENGMVVI
jgi:hypothetical protein